MTNGFCRQQQTGTTLNFKVHLLFSGIRETPVTVKNEDILISEVKNLLGKAAIEAVPFADHH